MSEATLYTFDVRGVTEQIRFMLVEAGFKYTEVLDFLTFAERLQLANLGAYAFPLMIFFMIGLSVVAPVNAFG